MGTHLRVLSESYPMNTNMTGFRWFSKIFGQKLPCIGRVKIPARLMTEITTQERDIALQRDMWSCSRAGNVVHLSGRKWLGNLLREASALYK